MKEKKSIDCPFCLSPIEEAAWVCKYCQREVRMVIDLQTENKRLKQLVEEGGTTAEPAIDPTVVQKVDPEVARPEKRRWVFSLGLTIILYLVVGTLLGSTLFNLRQNPLLTVYIPLFLYQCAFILLLPILVYVFMRFVDNSNLYILAIFVFAQPLLIPLITTNMGAGPDSINSAFCSAFVFAGVFLLAGGFIWIVRKEKRKSDFFSWKGFIVFFQKYVDIYDFFSKLLGIGAVLAIVYYTFTHR